MENESGRRASLNLNPEDYTEQVEEIKGIMETMMMATALLQTTRIR